MRTLFLVPLVMPLICASVYAQAASPAIAPPPASPPALDRAAIDTAVRETLAEEKAKAHAAQADRPLASTASDSRLSSVVPNKYETFDTLMEEARLPDCLHSEGLRHQPTFLLGGYLALPFIAVAKLRGVCR